MPAVATVKRLPAVAPRLKPSCVQFSRRVFTVWWSALFVVHFTALTYHARITKFYWRLPGSPIGEMIELYDLSIPHSYSRFVSVVNAGIAAVHAIALLRMLRNSARARQLVFFVDTAAEKARTVVYDTTLSMTPVAHVGRFQQLRVSVRRLFAYNGPLGVEGKYFDLFLYVAEFVETFLQTYQAYRVDALVARRWLSRLYVSVLAFNCWCVPLIHVVYRHHVAKKRLLSLMCDCFLDLVSSVVVPGALFFVYLADYDPVTHSIERTRWYDDRWLVQLWSEHELVVIVSWVDALSRLVFALGLLLSLEGVKQLLRAETVRDLSSRPSLVKRMSRQLLRLVTTTTVTASSTEIDYSSSVRRFSTAVRRYTTGSLLVHLQRVRWAAMFHMLLALWGVVVVAIHIATEIQHGSTPSNASCPIQFHKWLGRAPVCLLLDINCDALQIHGSAVDVERQWTEIEPSSVLRVVLRHCDAVEMPRSILQFRNLKAIKLYNSTLVNWDVEAALNGEKLQAFRSLQFVRVAMLPPGLLTPAFPRNVRIMVFCVTNLASLPADVETAWPSGMRLSLEWSAFTSVPPVALRLSPWQLSMSGNAITDVPVELFELPHIRRVGLAHTLITTLPSNVSSSSSTLKQVSIVNSPIRVSPLWMEDVVDRAHEIPYLVVALYAGDTPFCTSRSHGELLSRCVSCRAAQDDVSYPLAFEDQQSGI